MKNRLRLSLLAALLAVVSLIHSGCAAEPPGATEAKAAEAVAAKAWAQLPEILKRIVPPKFPIRDFDITKFGAVGDGATDCTKAFADAIAA